ncbi:uncharacterized protein [Palaemon carinicauda]|uniref:uncharacterized protein n=1 Tax=Palaemon carinicauda TaxID=392227 RepID=UPI0035B6763C
MNSVSYVYEEFRPHQTGPYNNDSFPDPFSINNPSDSTSGHNWCGSTSTSFGTPQAGGSSDDMQGSPYQMLQDMTPFSQLPSKKTIKKPLYLCDVQEDPVMEEKRLRSIKAFKNRVKNEKKEEELSKQLSSLEQEVEGLKYEKYQTECAISYYEDEIYKGHHHHGYFPLDITDWSQWIARDVIAAMEANGAENELLATRQPLITNTSSETGEDVSLLMNVHHTSFLLPAYDEGSLSFEGSKKKRKPKLYQLGPQEDKELEFKRVRALKAHKHRERKDISERQKLITIKAIESEISHLKRERDNLRNNVSQLEFQFASQKL